MKSSELEQMDFYDCSTSLLSEFFNSFYAACSHFFNLCGAPQAFILREKAEAAAVMLNVTQRTSSLNPQCRPAVWNYRLEDKADNWRAFNVAPMLSVKRVLTYKSICFLSLCVCVCVCVCVFPVVVYLQCQCICLCSVTNVTIVTAERLCGSWCSNLLWGWTFLWLALRDLCACTKETHKHWTISFYILQRLDCFLNRVKCCVRPWCDDTL